MPSPWTANQIPRLSGRTAVVTGANSGLGQVTARELARAGASRDLACRNAGKGEDAAAAIRARSARTPTSRSRRLDLADLTSVRGVRRPRRRRARRASTC